MSDVHFNDMHVGRDYTVREGVLIAQPAGPELRDLYRAFHDGTRSGRLRAGDLDLEVKVLRVDLAVGAAVFGSEELTAREWYEEEPGDDRVDFEELGALVEQDRALESPEPPPAPKPKRSRVKKATS